MPIEFPPGLVLVVGALLMPLIGRFLGDAAFKLSSLILPLLCLGAVWSVEEPVKAEFLDYTLTLAQYNPATKVFGTIFTIMAFGGALFAYNQDRRVELPGAFFYAGSAV